MHERVQHCQDPQTEFALFCESLGVSRINHILRVHGHRILQEQWAAEIFEEVGQRSLERLFPGLTENSMTQATLSAGQSGIGYKRARDVAAPAHLGALIAAKPHPNNDPRRSLGRPSTRAPLGDSPFETATSTFLSALDDDDQATDRTTESWWEVASDDAAVPSWTHSWNTQKPAATPKPRGAPRVCSCCSFAV